MGLFTQIGIWCDKYELRRCASIEDIDHVLRKYAGLEIPAQIREIAFSQLLAMGPGKTDDERMAYAKAVGGFPQGAERAVARLVALLGNQESTLQLAVLADYCPKKTNEVVRVISKRTDDAVPEALRRICQGTAQKELGGAYKEAFQSLCRRGTPEALDVATEIFYKNTTLLQESLYHFVETRINHGEINTQAVALLEVLTSPEKLVPCLQVPRTKYALGIVFNRLQQTLEVGGCTRIDLDPLFTAASQEAEAPSKTVAAHTRVFPHS